MGVGCAEPLGHKCLAEWWEKCGYTEDPEAADAAGGE